MAAPITKFYGVRVNVPGSGPAILPFETTQDLSASPCNFNGAGAPASGTLLLGRTDYIVGDLYADTTNKNLWTCTTAGTNATSTWAQISGGGGGGIDFAAPILYNHVSTYAAKKIVYVAPTDALVTAGTFDPDAGKMVYSIAGLWVSIKAVAPVINPAGLPAGTYYHIPQMPLPAPSAPDDPRNYWLLLTPDAQCYS